MFRASLALAFLSLFGIPAKSLAFQREIPSVANTVAEEIAASGKKSVAVVDFTDLQGNVTELGRFVAEEMALGLVTAKKGLSVVDRTHLRAILQENKLGSSGLIDPATARKLGQITGVEALVTGSMTVLGDSIRLVVKVLDTNTARILAASSIDIAKTKTIEELMGRDVRGSQTSGMGGQPSVQQDVQASPGNVPVFQSGSIKATVGQIAVSPDNRRVGLSVILENTSRVPVYIALQYANQGFHSPPSLQVNVSLSDDRATSWRLISASGLQSLPRNYAQAIHKQGDFTGIATLERRSFVLSLSGASAPQASYGLGGVQRNPSRTTASQSDFTAIAPSERVTMVMNFVRGSGDDVPGTTFSFSAQCVLYTSSGLRNVAIGLAGIKATVLRQ